MLRQTGFELFKMLRRPRSYIGFAAFALISFFVTWGVARGEMGWMPIQMAQGSGLSVYGSPNNAAFMAWMLVGSPVAHGILIMFMPFFVSLVFGEIVAGEVADGTLRTVLTRPIGRLRFFAAKVGASVIYGTALVVFLALASYLAGLIAFGRGGLLAVTFAPEPMIAWYAEAEGMVRLALAYGLTLVGVLAVGMVAFFIGCWLNNSLGAIGATMMLLFTMLIIGEIPYFRPIREYLLSTHLLAGVKAFADPLPWREIGTSMLCLGVYLAVLLVLSAVIFNRKDILA